MNKIEILGMAVGFVLLFGSLATITAIALHRRVLRSKAQKKKADNKNWTLDEILAREG
jgi:hypothetical protein